MFILRHFMTLAVDTTVLGPCSRTRYMDKCRYTLYAGVRVIVSLACEIQSERFPAVSRTCLVVSWRAETLHRCSVRGDPYPYP